MSSVEVVHRILAEHGLTDAEELTNFMAFVGSQKDIQGDLSKLKVAELRKVGVIYLVH